MATIDEIGAGSLDEILRTLSTLLVVVAPSPPVQTVDEFRIETWRSFHIVRALSARPPADRVSCQLQSPRGMTIGPDEIAVRLLAGTADVDGVTITMGGPEAHLEFKSEQQYVMLAEQGVLEVATLLRVDRSLFRILNPEVYAPTFTVMPWHSFWSVPTPLRLWP